MIEGYRFYADLDRELAEEGMAAVNEVWPEFDESISDNLCPSVARGGEVP